MTEAAAAGPLVSVRGLGKEFQLPRARLLGPRPRVTAVENVSFDIPAGATFGLVGESGSGKSTIAKMILKLERPDAGTIAVGGKDVFAQTPPEEKEYRRTVQAVLQDPYGALSPRLKVKAIVAEPLLAQGADRRTAASEVARLLDAVGLSSDAGERYPHEFSGGQRQRIAVARALSVDPRILVLDEPVSALDVSIRAQILALLRDMQRRLGLTYLFIGHDLAVVKYISAIVGVMYFGRLVEIGPADGVLRRPLHPYTRRLVAVASMHQPVGQHRLTGELPNPLHPPSGCHFHTRCSYATAECQAEAPGMHDAGDAHRVACHHFEAIEAGGKARTGPLNAQG